MAPGCLPEAYANILAAKQSARAEGARAVRFICQSVKVSDPLMNLGMTVSLFHPIKIRGFLVFSVKVPPHRLDLLVDGGDLFAQPCHKKNLLGSGFL